MSQENSGASHSGIVRGSEFLEERLPKRQKSNEGPFCAIPRRDVVLWTMNKSLLWFGLQVANFRLRCFDDFEEGEYDSEIVEEDKILFTVVLEKCIETVESDLSKRMYSGRIDLTQALIENTERIIRWLDRCFGLRITFQMSLNRLNIQEWERMVANEEIPYLNTSSETESAFEDDDTLFTNYNETESESENGGA